MSSGSLVIDQNVQNIVSSIITRTAWAVMQRRMQYLAIFTGVRIQSLNNQTFSQKAQDWHQEDISRMYARVDNWLMNNSK